MAATTSMALSAAQWVSNRVHRIASYVWSSADMAFSPGLTEAYILVVWIAQPADCRPAFLAKHPHFATWQNDGNPITLFCHNFCSAAGASNEFPSLAGRHFNIMNLEAGRNRFQGHRITDLRFTSSATFEAVSDLDTQRR
jgi:hypothetical protein